MYEIGCLTPCIIIFWATKLSPNEFFNFFFQFFDPSNPPPPPNAVVTFLGGVGQNLVGMWPPLCADSNPDPIPLVSSYGPPNHWQVV